MSDRRWRIVRVRVRVLEAGPKRSLHSSATALIYAVGCVEGIIPIGRVVRPRIVYDINIDTILHKHCIDLTLAVIAFTSPPYW